MVFFSGEIDKFWNKKIWHAKLGLRTGEHFSCVLMTGRHRLYWQYPQWRRRRRRKVSVSSDKSSWSLVSSRPSHSLRGSRSIHPRSQISWSQLTNSVWSQSEPTMPQPSCKQSEQLCVFNPRAGLRDIGNYSKVPTNLSWCLPTVPSVPMYYWVLAG